MVPQRATAMTEMRKIMVHATVSKDCGTYIANIPLMTPSSEKTIITGPMISLGRK